MNAVSVCRRGDATAATNAGDDLPARGHARLLHSGGQDRQYETYGGGSCHQVAVRRSAHRNGAASTRAAAPLSPVSAKSSVGGRAPRLRLFGEAVESGAATAVDR